MAKQCFQSKSLLSLKRVNEETRDEKSGNEQSSEIVENHLVS